MNSDKTVNQTVNQFMNDYIFRKYKQNINRFVNSVNIFPKDYKLKKSIEKEWFVYFKYTRDKVHKRHTAKQYELNGQNIQVNRIKDHSERMEAAEYLKEFVQHQLRTDPKFITSLIYGYDKAFEMYPSIFESSLSKKKDHISIQDAFEKAFEFKQDKVGAGFIKALKSIKNRFLDYIGDNKDNSIELLSKSMLLDFLNDVSVSNRSFNNNRTSLTGLLNVMVEYGHIKENPLLNVKTLKIKNKINKAYPEDVRIEIVDHLRKEEPLLYYYYLHIYYGFMRPIEINRLQVKDIDLVKMLYTNESKTSNYVMSIPKVIFDECYSKLDLKNANPEMYLFGLNKMLDSWDIKDSFRQMEYGKKYRPVKKLFKLDSVYTWYSFRHNAIGKMFENKLKELQEAKEPNYIEKAIEFVRQFTNHTTNKQTREYLREISSVLHLDSSDYLK